MSPDDRLHTSRNFDTRSSILRTSDRMHLFLADFSRLYGSAAAVHWKLSTSPKSQHQNGYSCHFHVVQQVNFHICSFLSCLKKHLTEPY